MASEPRNTTSTKPPSVETLLFAAESAWREKGCPRWRLVFYELTEKKIREDYTTASQAFGQVRAWIKFLEKPSFTTGCVLDERGRNKNQYWNDLELAICRYNFASVLQGLMWFAGTDRHSMIPDHRRLPMEQQPKQRPPFPTWLMEGYREPEPKAQAAGPLAQDVAQYESEEVSA